MIDNKLIHYVCFGAKAEKSLIKSLKSLTDCKVNIPVNILTDKKIYIGNNHSNFKFSYCDKISNSNVVNSRWYKTQLNKVQVQYNLYLDADTIVQSSDVLKIFDLLESGFEFVIAPSKNQNNDLFWHIEPIERQQTLDSIGYSPLQLQAGVFGWSNTIDNLFNQWHEEYKVYKSQDQAALIRAFAKCEPLPKVYLLSNAFNGGTIVKHNFGEIRTNGDR